jgi:hypothetical protein
VRVELAVLSEVLVVFETISCHVSSRNPMPSSKIVSPPVPVTLMTGSEVTEDHPDQ